MNNNIIFVKTHRAMYLVKPVKDPLRDSMGVLFGYCYHCIVTKIWQFGYVKKDEPKVWHRVNQYNKYVSSRPIQVCHKDDIEELRDATNEERALFNRCASGAKTLLKSQSKWLRDNAMDDQTIGIEH